MLLVLVFLDDGCRGFFCTSFDINEWQDTFIWVAFFVTFWLVVDTGCWFLLPLNMGLNVFTCDVFGTVLFATNCYLSSVCSYLHGSGNHWWFQWFICQQTWLPYTLWRYWDFCFWVHPSTPSSHWYMFDLPRTFAGRICLVNFHVFGIDLLFLIFELYLKHIDN